MIMGLDMYAYVATKPGQQREFYDTATWDSETAEFHNDKVSKPREIAYWRKHPNLHGWMENLWHEKNTDPSVDPSFNGVELELTWHDLEKLEHAIKNKGLPHTEGFFFGDPSDDYYREADLNFIGEARFYLLAGGRVFYNSSW